ncbi:MAG TPA: alpha-glycosidase, partial [Lachnoclostridium phytofermentans]
KGIITKLDYIKDLGANTIYLTPIFLSKSNHKYDTIDYKEIDPQFGNNEDLKELVTNAHKKGVRIVLDAVFNHCSNKMMQFQDVVKKGKESEYYNWFYIHGDTVTTEPCNYECFGACDYMPKLNTSNEEVRKFLIDIACYYIKEFDIDGWRLDVSDEISHDFWRLFRKEIKKIKEDCVIIGENWHDAYPFLMGDQFDSIMNYSFTKACLDYFAFEKLHTQNFVYKLNEILMRNKQAVNEMMLNLLDSHDTHRFFTEIKKDKDKLMAAIAIATCYLGAPCIYYGTEICMEGGYDPDSRRTFDWEETNWDSTVISTIRKVLSLKKEPSLQEGEIKLEAIGEVFSLERYLENESITLLYNAGCCDEVLDSLNQISEKECKIVVENGFQNDVLRKGGFIILKKTIS